MTYSNFLSRKIKTAPSVGLDAVLDLNPILFDFQRLLVTWALKKGRAAIFAECGLGKTFMQVEWAKYVPGAVLIVAPLAVADQTILEAAKLGVEVVYSNDGCTDGRKITITNYERLQHFDAGAFNGVVLDESSILKSFDGKTRNLIIEMFAKTPFKLCCSATPAPNDYMELGNHAEFLNIMSRTEMLSTFFVHDAGETQVWRLKGHAQADFWRWVSTWGATIKSPADIGCDASQYNLPALNLQEVVVEVGLKREGELFETEARTLQERIKSRKHTVKHRAEAGAKIVNASNEPWIIWCALNNEADEICRLIPGAKEIRGSDPLDKKQRLLTEFSSGALRILVSKPSICGFGLNWQHCNNIMFLGLSDSYEEYYQALRRCWRFGQKKTVNVHLVIAMGEGAVLKNIQRKEKEALEMSEKTRPVIEAAVRHEIAKSERVSDVYKSDTIADAKFTAQLGDSCELIKDVKSESIHYSIFSPPFASLYTYSNSHRDMGNCSSTGEFFEHFDFLVSELFRVLKSGRLVSFHCMNLPTTKTHDGYIGIKDFRGELIRKFQEHGFLYHSEVCIWKDPVTAMQRTKALGLLHKQIKKDSCMSRQGIPDYLVTMRKPGVNPEPVTHTNDSFPVGVWQNYASPIWMDINPSDTLQHRSAREHEDEKHICPLQLSVIRRALELWSNPGDTVLSPFMGIGSEGYVALTMGRKFHGMELKKSYFDQAVKNLRSVTDTKQLELWAPSLVEACGA